MAKNFKIQVSKTYATEANAIKAVEKKNYPDTLRYFVYQDSEGRFAPVFVGQAAIEYGVHFDFNVVG